MATWHVNELSKLTKVTVRSLHYYDQIGLLTPSMRAENGYRLYSETDLVRLQQIVALKHFGFSLKMIKGILENDSSPLEHLKHQEQHLSQQIADLKSAHKCLTQLLSEATSNTPLNWEATLKLIEVYKMTENLKNTWAGKVYSDQALEEFAKLGAEWSPDAIKKYEKRWQDLIQKVEQNLHLSPQSKEAQALARSWVDLFEEAYGNSPILQKEIKQAYEGDKIPEPPFGKEVMAWIEEAKQHL